MYYLILLPFIISSDVFGFAQHFFLGRFSREIEMLSIVLVWIIFRFNYKKYIPKTKTANNIKLLFSIYLIYITIELLLSFAHYNNILGSIFTARRFLYYISILLFVDILVRFPKSRLEKIFGIIKIITIITTISYILTYGFGIELYTYAKVYSSYQSQIIYRTVYAHPYFSFFVFSSILFKKKPLLFDYGMIGLILIAVFLTFTRSLIMIYLFMTLAIIYFKSIVIENRQLSIFSKIKSLFKLTRNHFAIIVLFAIIMYSIIELYPTQLGYFISRLDKTASLSNIKSDYSITARKDIILSRIELTKKENPIFGVGFLNSRVAEKFYPNLFVREADLPGTIIIGDQSWGNIIGTLGFLGATIYIILLIYPVQLVLKNRGLDNYAYAAGFSIIAIIANFVVSNDALKEITKLSFYISIIVYYIPNRNIGLKKI